MIEGDIKRLERNNVGNIIQRGGTALKTARSLEFMTKEVDKSIRISSSLSTLILWLQ